MLDLRRWLAAFAGALFAFALPAQAAQTGPAPVHLAWVPGDTSMPAALAARQALLARWGERLRITLVSDGLAATQAAAALADADAVIVRNHAPALAVALAAATRALVARGGKAWAVDASFGEAESAAGLRFDAELAGYERAGGSANLQAMLERVLARDFGWPLAASVPRPMPTNAYWDLVDARPVERFEPLRDAYLARHPERAGWPWVAVVFNRTQALGGQLATVEAVSAALVQRHLNPLPVFGHPPHDMLRALLLDEAGRSHVQAIVGMALKLGTLPEQALPVLESIDAPVLNAITLTRSDRASWEASPTGMDLAERSWQIAGAEFAGAIAPTVIATREPTRDAATGLSYLSEQPVAERVERLAERVARWVALRQQPNADKRVALIYYNYPAGKANVGATYLNVMARSLWSILERLRAEGYDTQGAPADETALFDTLQRHAVNVPTERPGALAELVAGGQAVLLPVAQYRRWLAEVPRPLLDAINAHWGRPEQSRIMTWRDAAGTPYFVFPALRVGKLAFLAQPVRADTDEIAHAYHDVTLPPHHQYLAFHLWLQRGFAADAMVHVGTHGTLEWLPGREVGFTAADPPEVMVGSVPQLYPYNVDVVGEGLQAKRRGMAALVSHLTPPLGHTGLTPELAELKGLLDDWKVAAQGSEAAADAQLQQIAARARATGVLADLGLAAIASAEDAERLEQHIEEIGNQVAPLGLHTFGVPPAPAAAQALAQAMAAQLKCQSDPASMAPPPDTKARPDTAPPDCDPEAGTAAYRAAIEASARAELQALVAGLSGRFVTAGPGGDPLRVPASLPTGRNFYAFDPARLPSPATYARGSALAGQMTADFRQRHGAWPRRLMFSLWSNEAMRHGGIVESEILALLGVRPVWDRWGKVSGVEVIPRAELGRPRVDVTVVPSGLYRDSLPTLMTLLDAAVSAVAGLKDEPDNAVARNSERIAGQLAEQGVPADEAARVARVRLFSQPPGAYGVGLDHVIQASNSWDDEAQVADVYFRRVGHLFGQGFWGDQPQGEKAAIATLKLAMRDVQGVVHSRASNLFGVLDNDDVYQALGGAALAVRAAGGARPEALILNLQDPRAGRHETLARSMGREMQVRYLNPQWIEPMLAEGYAGARAVQQMVDNLWGWQVTVPEVVDAGKWQALFETYVQDRHQLGIRDRFRAAHNMDAWQALVDRMLSAVEKGYWTPDAATIDALRQANAAAIDEAGVACTSDRCSTPDVTRRARADDERTLAEFRWPALMRVLAETDAPTEPAAAASASMTQGFGLQAGPAPAAPVPAAAPPSTPAAVAPAPIQGQLLREVPRDAPSPSARTPSPSPWLIGWLLACLAAGAVWQWRGLRRSSIP